MDASAADPAPLPRHKKYWRPLESDPEILTSVARRLGLSEQAHYVDVFGPEETLLAMVPRPVYAMVLLTPEPDEVILLDRPWLKRDDRHIFIKQTLGHACGTMAMLHSILNSDVPYGTDTELARIKQACKGKTADEGAAVLENSDILEDAHTSHADKGQTEPIDAHAKVGHGYTSFVEQDGHILEYCGYKDGVVDHGAVEVDLLHDVSNRILKAYQGLYPGSDAFSLMALCGN